MMQPEDDDFRGVLDVDDVEEEDLLLNGPSAPKKMKGGRPSRDVWTLLLGETPTKQLDKKSLKCSHCAVLLVLHSRADRAEKHLRDCHNFRCDLETHVCGINELARFCW